MLTKPKTIEPSESVFKLTKPSWAYDFLYVYFIILFLKQDSIDYQATSFEKFSGYMNLVRVNLITLFIFPITCAGERG